MKKQLVIIGIVDYFFFLSSRCLFNINRGGIESNIPMMRKGMSKEEPKYVSKRSHMLLNIKTDAITNISSQKI